MANVFEQRAAALEQDGKWSEAARYLNRYLQLQPDDLEARVRLVEAVQRSPRTIGQRRQLLGLLYQTVGLLPERHDLRLKLANELLDSGDWDVAEREAKETLKSPRVEDQQGARRVIALSLCPRARAGGLVTTEAAAAALAGALKENPGDVTLATRTAELYRQDPQHVGVDNAPDQADAIMDRLVQVSSDQAQALLARYIYRHRYVPTQNARHDLDTLLSRDPDNIEALLLLANAEIEMRGDANLNAAEQKLLRVCQLKPGDYRGHVGLARLYVAKNERQRAADLLSRCRSQLETSPLEVEGLLAGVLIELRHLDEAEKVLSEFDDEVRRQISDATTDLRINLENASRLLHAQLNLGRNKPGQAVRELNAIIASVADAEVTAGGLERLRAHAMLGVVMSQLGRPDQAAAQWKAVADRDPKFMDAAVQAAAAYLALGRPNDAIAQLEPYVRRDNAAPEARCLLVQAHLQKQLSLVASERNWSEFSSVLQQAQQKLPEHSELLIAEARYRHSLGTESDDRIAGQLLHKLEATQAANSALLARIALCYQQIGAPADATRILEQFEKIEPNPVRRVLLRSALLVQQGHSERVAKLLIEKVATLSPTDRRELQLAVTKLLLDVGQVADAQQIVSSVIEAAPRDPAALLLGVEIALARQDFVAAERLEDVLKTTGTADDFDWRFCRARRLVGQFAKLDAHARSTLDSLLESLRSERPDWYPLVALVGQHADLAGNRAQAVEAFRLAVELGDRRPETFERLVTALYAEGRYNDAEVYVARLTAEQPSDNRVESLAIAQAIQQNRLPEAVTLARQIINRGTNDPMQYVWFASLLSLNNQQKEADGVFHDAIGRFPKDPRVWNALFTNLVRTKQLDRARRVLAEWSEKAGGDERGKQFILAQGYELLGDAAAAQERYRAAIASDPHNSAARLRFAKSLLATDITAARREFEELLKQDARQTEARRYLASILAASGNEADWNRAAQLLEPGQQTKGVDEQHADDRLRAILLSRRGRNRSERLENCEAARRVLIARLDGAGTGGVDLDRMLLAAILEQESAIRNDPELVLAARDALRPLVERKKPPASYLVAYIETLLRYLERAGSTGNSPRRVEQRAAVLRDAEIRIDTLDTALRGVATTEGGLTPIAVRVRLLVAQHKSEAGLKLLNQFATEQFTKAANDSEKAKLLLQLGNLATAVGYHPEAESWYRQLLTIVPGSYVLLVNSLSAQKKFGDAVDLCLRMAPDRPAGEVATVLTQLLATAGNPPELEARAGPTITAAVAANRDNVELLMSAAVRAVMADHNDEAIRLFRKVLERQPNHAMALNNLATLLAERPNQLTEAQEYAERAVATGGSSPALLDTLGTIQIRAGKPEQAIRDLEEAVAGDARDPRYYFHLAVAYQRVQRRQDAQRELDQASKYGLEQAILTAGDRELLASLKQSLRTTAHQD